MLKLEQFNPNKVLCHYEKVCTLLKSGDVYPVTIEINPTNRCNHKCIWCTYGYLKNGSSKGDMLSRDLLLRIIKEIIQLDTKAIIWTGGGEPLLNKATFDAMKLAAKNSLEQSIHTNGSLLRKEICDFMVENFTYIRISLDAASEKTHMKLHRSPKGDFSKILNNLKTLIELKEKRNSDMAIGISLLLHPENYHEIEDIAKLSKEIGVDYLQFKPIVIWGLREQLPTDYLEKSFETVGEIRLLEEYSKLSIRLLNYKFHDLINSKGDFGRNYSKCYGHPLVGSIGANGSVDLCCSFKGIPEWSFGNLKERSFKKIWTSEKRQEVIKQVDLSKCEPLCRIHEINKILDYMKSYDYHKNFI